MTAMLNPEHADVFKIDRDESQVEFQEEVSTLSQLVAWPQDIHWNNWNQNEGNWYFLQFLVSC